MGVKVLLALRRPNIEGYFIINKWANTTTRYEIDYTLTNVIALADHVHGISDMAAQVASRSFHANGIIVVRCIVKRLTAVNGDTEKT